MNFTSSVTNAQHNRAGQKVPEYLAQLRQHNALLKEPFALSQKALALSQKEKALQQALSSLAVIRDELLLVLAYPHLPLHNNLSESLIGKYVKRRKTSGGTQSESGRQSHGTFASLKKICRLYGLSFCHYLMDRLSGNGAFPELAGLIPLKAPGLLNSGALA